MRFVGNMFHSAGAHVDGGVLTAFKLNETNGEFDRQQITNSLVEGNSYSGVKGATTRVQRSLWSNPPQSTWAFDLCDDMLFTNTTTSSSTRGRVTSGAYKEDIFAFLQYSVRVQDAATELGASAISSVEGCVVTVTTEKPVSGAVYLTADQSRDDNTCHGRGCHPKGYRVL